MGGRLNPIAETGHSLVRPAALASVGERLNLMTSAGQFI